MVRLHKIELPPIVLTPKAREDNYFNPSRRFSDLPMTTVITHDFALRVTLGPRQGIRHIIAVDLREKGEETILVKTAVDRLFGALGLAEAHARTLLINNLIPIEWRKYFLIFPGTTYKDSEGNFFVPTAIWNQSDDWHTGEAPYEGVIGEDTRVVVAQDV